MEDAENINFIYTFLIGVFFVHLILLFFDRFFKSCKVFPYHYIIKKTGTYIGVCSISWFTTIFNRKLQKWGRIRPKIQSAWFHTGLWVSMIFMPIAIILMFYTTFSAMKVYLKNSITLDQERPVVFVEPMIPGWNIPWSDIVYYISSIFCSCVIHELGHAMAGIREGVHLAGFSFVILFIFPVVITYIDAIDTVSPIRQLKIYCAGVWHNIFFALVAAVIATTFPWFLYPLYEVGTGVQVLSISEGSFFSNRGGLVIGDKIIRVNECQVRGIASWQECLSLALHSGTNGFCLPDNFIREHDESIPDQMLSEMSCCSNNSPLHLCFEYMGKESEPLPLPQQSCLLARYVVDLNLPTCYSASDCPKALHCFKPILGNNTKLMRVYRAGGHAVSWLGTPQDIYQSIEISQFISKYSYFPSSIPDGFTKFCQFITMFSMGLAFLNILPCFYFDGQFIVTTAIEAFLTSRIKTQLKRQTVAQCINTLGTLLLILYVYVMLFCYI